jgi:hypothetical protein
VKARGDPAYRVAARFSSGERGHMLFARGFLQRTSRGVLMVHAADRHTRHWSTLAVAVATAFGASACAFHRGAQANLTSTITEAEIDSVHALSAYDAVKKLRPQFLVSRGRMSIDPKEPPALPNVYVDNQYYGDITELRNISAATIELIKFYSASEAQYAFGRGNMAGAINILTKH